MRKKGFLNATDVADYLAKKNVPFRKAHEISGKIVSYCENKNLDIEEMTLEEFKKFSDIFENDIFNEITLESCVNKRNSYGGTSSENVRMQIKKGKKYIENFE
ncbi:MAG: hypothetical protein Q4D53_06410 [Leptotrichiaceae bacterium]|nr:hypothetical protein [Leptotrichiaceae bacterium]